MKSIESAARLLPAIFNDATVAVWMDNIPPACVGTPHEMGPVALFLASEEAAYVTGANLLADGGMTALSINKER